MNQWVKPTALPSVALLAEGVGRNFAVWTEHQPFDVALLAEGVGRNYQAQHHPNGPEPSPSSRRAWVEITRNKHDRLCASSPSSRRAWVEITGRSASWGTCAVALLAEGVGRNGSEEAFGRWVEQSPSSRRAWVEIRARASMPTTYLSPSSRRAWVEIARTWTCGTRRRVALLAEGVGRNVDGARRRPKQRGVALLAEGVGRNSENMDVRDAAASRPPRGGRG